MSRRPTPPARTPARAHAARTDPPRSERPRSERPRRASATPARGRRGTPPRPTVSRARDQVVSRTSAARFAARARARRWATWRVLLGAVVVLAVLGGAAWVLLASSLLAVREVGVVGADRLDRAAVVELARGTRGTPLARVDTEAVEAALAALPLVKEVEVVRAWPHTLEVRLVERVPVLAVPAAGGYSLVDAESVVVAHVDAPPPDLPLIRLDAAPVAARPLLPGNGSTPEATQAALAAAADVVAALPEDLRADVAQVTLATPDDVRLELRDGDEVVWGSPTDSALKTQVLQALRSQEADVYDVSAPLTPVTR